MYWKEEYKFWGDVISYRNWTHYAQKVHEEKIRNKKVLKNFDKYAARKYRELGKTHVSQCLDPERVQRFVNYIKEKESANLIIKIFIYLLIIGTPTTNDHTAHRRLILDLFQQFNSVNLLRWDGAGYCVLIGPLKVITFHQGWDRFKTKCEIIDIFLNKIS